MKFGMLAEFSSPADLMHAAEKIRDAGFRRWDVFSPYPIHGMNQAMGLKNSKVGWFGFIGGCTGYTTGMVMIWWMNAHDYPILVGGKPMFSPYFAFPPSYELTILFAAFGSIIGMMLLNRLPRLYNPLQKIPRFAKVTHDSYFLCIETTDPKYSEAETRKLLESTGGKNIEIVED